MYYKANIHKELIKKNQFPKEFCPFHFAKRFFSSPSTFADYLTQEYKPRSTTRLSPSTQTENSSSDAENTNACLTKDKQCWPYLPAKQNL